jgi:hypothetical protein
LGETQNSSELIINGVVIMYTQFTFYRKLISSRKLGAFRAVAIAACLMLGASAAQSATEVILDTDSRFKAIGITDLDIGGTLYNVTFASDSLAVRVYGEFPGTFTFTTEEDAQAAVDAIVAALNDSVAQLVGDETTLDVDPLARSFNVGYDSADIFGAKVALIVAGDYVSDTWSDAGADSLGYNIDQRTYAVLQPVPIPAAAWLFGSALIGLAGIARKR